MAVVEDSFTWDGLSAKTWNSVKTYTWNDLKGEVSVNSGVVEVLAEINGSRCMLENTGGNIWSIVAPSYCPNGNYVCAFWAKDKAGNIAYKTAILWIVDGRLTCIKWIEDKYQLKFKLSDEYSCHYIESVDKYFCYHIKLLDEYSCRYIESFDEYSCRYVKPRCTRND